MFIAVTPITEMIANKSFQTVQDGPENRPNYNATGSSAFAVSYYRISARHSGLAKWNYGKMVRHLQQLRFIDEINPNYLSPGQQLP